MISADRLDVSQINFHATRMGNFFLSLAAIVEQPELVEQGKMNEGSKEGKEEE